MISLQLTVNGESRSVSCAADAPLLWVLRDTLGLTGTKYGCGIGVCGACTVLVDGAAVRSCTVRAASLAGKEIQTIEGLAADRSHPLQKAWIAEEALQCGYCTPGQIMTAAGLLRQHPNPTDAEIDTAMAGVLCRCGSYARMRRAIRRAATGG